MASHHSYILQASAADNRTPDEDVHHTQDQSNCKNIKNSLKLKNEELSKISHILEISRMCNSEEKKQIIFFKGCTEKLLGINREILFIQLNEAQIPYNLNRAKQSLKKGDFDEVLSQCKKILRVDPNNREVQTILSALKNIPEYYVQAKDVADEHRIRYVGRFGQNILKKPISVVVDKPRRNLLISDYEANQIHRFDFDGEYIGPLNVSVNRPMGLFKGADKTWVCDFGHGRLIALDSFDCIIEEIAIEQFIGDRSAIKYPAYGCKIGDRFFIILLDNGLSARRKLFTFNRNNLENSIREIPPDRNEFYTCISNIAEDVYLSNGTPPVMFKYNEQLEKICQLNTGYIPEHITAFTNCGKNIYVCSPDYLIKFKSPDIPVYYIRFKNILSGREIYSNCISAINHGNRKILLIGDYNHPCIHMFSI